LGIGEEKSMSIPEIWKRIGIAESALENDGANAALKAVLDVLKEIAKELTPKETPTGTVPPPKIAMVPETGGRKFRKD
jgi:hypothetical protein